MLNRNGGTRNPLLNYSQRRIIDYSSMVMALDPSSPILCTTGDIVNSMGPKPSAKDVGKIIHHMYVWLDWATIQFRVFGPSSFNTALQLVLRPHFLVHFV
jgi:hypothetical protein